MKRFYKTVGLRQVGSRFSVELDGRAVKTPEREVLAMHSKALAECIAAEWSRQGEELGDMPLTKLANTAIDRVAKDRNPAIQQLADFLGHDLVCYRSAAPAELAAREAAAWDPPLEWARTKYRLDLKTTTGALSIPQPGFDAAGFAQHLSQADPFALTGLSAAAAILKSTVLALAMGDCRIKAGAAHAAAHVDAIYQAEKWGRDEDAEKRLAALLAELETANVFLQLAKS